jgi:hypothetical protein
MLPSSNLKPVFYRIGEALEIHSGWIDPETGDIWDTVYDNQKAMKLVPGAYPAFKVGQRVEFAEAVDIYPATHVLGGERAHVAYMEGSGEIGLFLEAVHMGLEDNTLPLVPFQNDDTLASMRVFKGAGVVPSRTGSLWSDALRLAAAVAIILAVWEGIVEGTIANAAHLPAHHRITTLVSGLSRLL